MVLQEQSIRWSAITRCLIHLGLFVSAVYYMNILSFIIWAFLWARVNVGFSMDGEEGCTEEARAGVVQPLAQPRRSILRLHFSSGSSLSLSTPPDACDPAGDTV